MVGGRLLTATGLYAVLQQVLSVAHQITFLNMNREDDCQCHQNQEAPQLWTLLVFKVSSADLYALSQPRSKTLHSW